MRSQAEPRNEVNPVSWYALMMNRQRMFLGSVFLVVVGLGAWWMPLPPTIISKKAEEITVKIDNCASGSGVMYQREGNTYSVLTVSHGVTDSPLNCFIFTPDGSRYEASQPKIPVPGVDLAVLAFTSQKDYKLAKWGDSEKVEQGQTVYVAGFPAPTAAKPIRQQTFTEGKITSTGKQDRGYGLTYNNITQPGMSGGPVLNQRGEAIGIHGRGDRDDRGNKIGWNLGIPIATFLGATEPFIALDSPQSPSSDSNRGTSDNNPPPSPSSRRENEQKPSKNEEEANQETISLSGAGASFPAPLYQRWFKEYNELNPNIQISYQSVGSGAGVKQFTSGTVDFGASDEPMKPEEIAQVSKGVVMLPMTAGSIVLAYNLPGINNLKLSRQAYVDIFLGKITQWNDPAIVAHNPNLALLNQPIQVVYRSDGSATTKTFTKHLTAISPEWKAGPGEGKTVNWPVGINAKGNEGVTAQIKQNQGAIGYVEWGYAQLNNLPMAALENKSGNFVFFTLESASKTLAAVELPDNLVAFITDPDGFDSYPIVTYTWLLAYKTYDNSQKAQALKDVIKWSLTEGQKVSKDLGYIPLPENVVSEVQATVDSIKP